MLGVKSASKETQGLLLALIAGIFLSIESITAKLAYAGGANMLTILAIRFSVAALFFWGRLLTVRSGGEKPDRAALGRLIGLILGFQSTTLLLLFYSFQHIPAAVAMLFFFIFPALVTLLAAFFLRENLTKTKLLSIMITFFGLMVIAGVPDGQLDIRGVTAALLAALTNGFFIVGQTRILRGLTPVVYNAYATLILGVFFLLLAYITGSFSLNFNLQAIIALIIMIIFSTVLAFLAMSWSLILIGASRAAIIITIQPLSTAIWGYFILNEALKPSQMLGGIIILAGVIWLQVSKPKQTTL